MAEQPTRREKRQRNLGTPLLALLPGPAYLSSERSRRLKTMVVMPVFVAACTSTPTATTEAAVELKELAVRFEIVESPDDMETFVRVASGIIDRPLTTEELDQGTRDVIEGVLGEVCSWWQDVGLGTSVTLLNASGQIVGSGPGLAGGDIRDSIADPDWIACAYEVVISQVSESDFYELEISGESLASVARTQLESEGWTMAVELADR